MFKILLSILSQLKVGMKFIPLSSQPFGLFLLSDNLTYFSYKNDLYFNIDYNYFKQVNISYIVTMYFKSQHVNVDKNHFKHPQRLTQSINKPRSAIGSEVS